MEVLSLEEFDSLVREVGKLLGDWEVTCPLDSGGSVARLHGNSAAIDCEVTLTIALDSRYAELSEGRLAIAGFYPDQTITVCQSESAAEIVSSIQTRLIPLYAAAVAVSKKRARREKAADADQAARVKALGTLKARLAEGNLSVWAVASNGAQPELYLYLDEGKAWGKYHEMSEQHDMEQAGLSIDEVLVNI